MSIAIRLRNGANYFSYTHIIEVGEGDEKSAGKLLLPERAILVLYAKQCQRRRHRIADLSWQPWVAVSSWKTTTYLARWNYCFRYKIKAVRISRLMQDKPRTPLETTCDWIEYVIRHGGATHLRAQVFNIPWYQYYLLDVIAFLVAIVTLVVKMIRLTCRLICRLCCEKSRNKAKKE